MNAVSDIEEYVELLEFPGIPYKIIRTDEKGKLHLTGFMESYFPSEVRSVPKPSNA